MDLSSAFLEVAGGLENLARMSNALIFDGRVVCDASTRELGLFRAVRCSSGDALRRLSRRSGCGSGES